MWLRGSAPLLPDGAGDEERGGGCESADERGLVGAAYRPRAREPALEVAEAQQGDGRRDDGKRQPGPRVLSEEVRRQRDESTGDVRAADRQGADQRALRVRLLQPELEAHHEVDPGLRTVAH